MNTQPEPAVVCEYWYLELPKVFSDVELLMKGLMPGSVLRLSTAYPEALWAVPAWCRATGSKVIGQDEMCEYPLGYQYIFDIERGDGNVHSSSLL